MTTYHPSKISLSNGQKEKLARAYKTSSPITIRLTKNQTSGSDELMLTATQINRINKAKSLGVGVEIKILKTQVRKVMREGGSLWSAIVPLARSLAPRMGREGGSAPRMGQKGGRAPRIGKHDPPQPVYGQWGDGTKKKEKGYF